MSKIWYEIRVLDEKGMISPVLYSCEKNSDAWSYLLFLIKHKGYFRCEVKILLMTKIDGIVSKFGEICTEYNEESYANANTKK